MKRFKMPNAAYSNRYGQFDEETTTDKSHRLFRINKSKIVRKVSNDESSKAVGISRRDLKLEVGIF